MHPSHYVLPWLAAATFTLASPQYPGKNRHTQTSSILPVTTSATVVSNPNATPSSSTGGNSGGSVCDATTTLTDDGYTIMANIWGKTADVVGSQCAQAAGSSGNGIAWSTTWNWERPDSNITSFANANGNGAVPCAAAGTITSIPTTWSWSYSITDSIIADVAYDIFLGGSACSPVGEHAYEVMIWLAFYGGLGPIGYPSSKKGTFAYQTYSFDVYAGPNAAGGIGMVYTFYPTTGNIPTFSGNLAPFFKYLETLDSSFAAANLQSIQAGTEASKGSATFSVSEYSIGGSGST